jgi:hypothetical protein
MMGQYDRDVFDEGMDGAFENGDGRRELVAGECRDGLIWSFGR